MEKQKVISFNECNIMSLSHKRWNEFYYRLLGPDGCDFRHNEKGIPIWNCANDMSFTINILKTMPEIDIDKSLEYFEENGGYCDCEILLNIDKDKGLLDEVMSYKENKNNL